jgi:hypothetical protein
MTALEARCLLRVMGWTLMVGMSSYDKPGHDALACKTGVTVYRMRDNAWDVQENTNPFQHRAHEFDPQPQWVVMKSIPSDDWCIKCVTYILEHDL